MSVMKIDPNPYFTQTDNTNYMFVVETSKSLCDIASSYSKIKKHNPMPENENVNFAKIIISPYQLIKKYECLSPAMREEITSISTLMKTMKLPENIRDQNIAHNNKSITFNIMYNDTQQQKRFNYCMGFCFTRMGKVEKKKEMIDNLLRDVFNASFPVKVSNIKVNHIFMTKDCFTDEILAINIKQLLLKK